MGNWKLEELELKKSINNLLWSFLPPDVTLGEAENLAMIIFNQVRTVSFGIVSPEKD